MTHFKFHYLLPAVAAALCLASCLLGPQSKRGSSIDNELGIGTIYSASGKPAENARVRVVPVGHIPDSLGDTAKGGSGDGILVTHTDADGKYRIDPVPEGEYNILADLSGQFAIQDSVYLNAATGKIPADTLGEPGALAGVIVVQPNHDPRSAFVQILGTTNFANVDARGVFHLEELAAGKYTLRVTVNAPTYATLFKRIVIHAGRRDSLADTLRPDFLGIPVVEGLTARFDTLDSRVTLSWNPVAYRFLSEYQIFRDETPVMEVSKVPIGTTAETTFVDDLGALLSGADQSVKSFQYRIRVANKSDSVGLNFGKVEVKAPAANYVSTKITLNLERFHWDSTLQADSVEVGAQFSNPGRKLVRLQWSIGNLADTLTSEPLGSIEAGKRTTKFRWAKEGRFGIWVRAWDDAGTIWTGTSTFGNSAPTITGSANKTAKAYLDYSMAVTAGDTDGDSLRFRIANRPKWASFDTLTGALSGTPSNTDTGTYHDIVISVTDGRRMRSLPPFDILTKGNPWSTVATKVDLGSLWGAAELNGKIYAFSNRVHVFDPLIETWATLTNSVPKSEYVVPMKDKLFLVSGNRDMNAPTIFGIIYDPATELFDTTSALPVSASFLAVTTGQFINGIFYGFGGGQVWAYDPATNSWAAKNAMPDWMRGENSPDWKYVGLGQSLAIGGKILLLGQEDLQNSNRSAAVTGYYNPDSDTWTLLDPIAPRIRGSLALIDGKAYYIGGLAQSYSGEVAEFNPETGKWKQKSAMDITMFAMISAVANGKLYIFSGSHEETQVPVSALPFTYDPTLDP